jgi:hypothetical protein
MAGGRGEASPLIVFENNEGNPGGGLALGKLAVTGVVKTRKRVTLFSRLVLFYKWAWLETGPAQAVP